MNLGAIFDWDGVVIDSAVQHERSWELLAEEEKKPLPPDHFEQGFGKVNAVIIPGILGWTDDPEEVLRLGLRKEQLYRDLLRENPITELPGVRNLLNALRDEGVPSVVGSSTPRRNLEVSIELLGLEGLFHDLVSSDDVTNGKPDPEVFLKAAERINCAPGRCIVFEDSLHGIKAGLAGGMKVVGVATTHKAEKLAAADKIVHRLTEITIDGLLQLVESPS